MPGRGRLSRLQVGVVGCERVAQLARVRPQRAGAVGERARELGRAAPRARAQGDAKSLAPRPAGAQPAGGVAADAAHELGLARVEGIAQLGLPGELVHGDRMQLEQAAEQAARRLGGQRAALGERHRMRDIGQREVVGEPRRGSQLVA